MKRITLFSFLLFTVLMVACSEEKSGESSTENESSPEVVGFYTYSDPTRGTYSLALMEQNRFMLVADTAQGVPQGAVGWYVLRDKDIHLSSDEVDAVGTVEGDIVRLRFGEADPESDLANGGLPFQRQKQPQEKPSEEGDGGSSNDSSGSSSEQSSDDSSQSSEQ